MDIYDAALVVHVLGWVFWLGTDVGVFFSAKFAERGDLTPETRLTLLELGMLLDRAPRFAVPIVWFTGVVLMHRYGYFFIPLTAASVVLAIWIGLTWAVLFRPAGSTLHEKALLAQALVYFMVIFGMGGAGSWLLATDQIPLWIAIKWFAYVGLAVVAILLERAFAPVTNLFQTLAVEGANDSLNMRIRTALKPVYALVLAIYFCTIVAAVSGLTKPFL